ncbi:MAG TPA: hypothetical protein VF173_10570 [Thermoanaerobaculia bacterium]|nr:hypothetical protein [Thermoanaerobaculia bacterium]
MNQTASASDVPDEIADTEALNRRIHPDFVRPDGSVSSQAFTDVELSVDRAAYWEVAQTLRGYDGYGVASLIALVARGLHQEVVADKKPLNPAHALVKGKKTKSIARALARSAAWVAGFGGGIPT